MYHVIILLCYKKYLMILWKVWHTYLYIRYSCYLGLYTITSGEYNNSSYGANEEKSKGGGVGRFYDVK